MNRTILIPVLVALAAVAPHVASAHLPDLKTGVIVIPGALHAAQLVTFSAPVYGQPDAAGSFPVLLQVQYQGPKDPKDVWWVERKESNYVTASSSVATATWNYGFDWAGSYRVRACVNHNVSWDAVVPESNYQNDCGPWQAVTVADAAHPNLVMAGMSGSPDPNDPTRVTLTATARNIADAPSGAFPIQFQIRDYATMRDVAVVPSAYVPGVPGWGLSSKATATYTFSGLKRGTIHAYVMRACANVNTSWVAITPESNYADDCGDWIYYDTVRGTVSTPDQAAPASTTY